METKDLQVTADHKDQKGYRLKDLQVTVDHKDQKDL